MRSVIPSLRPSISLNNSRLLMQNITSAIRERMKITYKRVTYPHTCGFSRPSETTSNHRNCGSRPMFPSVIRQCTFHALTRCNIAPSKTLLSLWSGPKDTLGISEGAGNNKKETKASRGGRKQRKIKRKGGRGTSSVPRRRIKSTWSSERWTFLAAERREGGRVVRSSGRSDRKPLRVGLCMTP